MSDQSTRMSIGACVLDSMRKAADFVPRLSPPAVNALSKDEINTSARESSYNSL